MTNNNEKKPGNNSSSDRRELINTNTQLLPLAYGNPENLITDDNVNKWLKDLEILAQTERGKHSLRLFCKGGIFYPDLALKRYRENLRFLSVSDATKGLRLFADDIINNFDPSNSLFYFPPESESANFFYLNLVKLNPKIAEYGRARDGRRGMKIVQKNKFVNNGIEDANAFIYVDDWVLSGDHISLFLTTDVDGKFHTYHLAVSKSGQTFFEKVRQHIQPRYLYTIPGEGFNVEAYGFHKIPDTIPSFYTNSAQMMEFSIFGEDEWGYVPKNRRLFNHSSIFV